MSMKNKMTPEEEEFALAEATKARQYLTSDEIRDNFTEVDYCRVCGQPYNINKE